MSGQDGIRPLPLPFRPRPTPLPKHPPEPKRIARPSARYMTLIAGFRCSDGFVIAADTEVTYGIVSTQGQKIVTSSLEDGDHRLIIAMAGNNANFCTMLAQDIRDAVSESTSRQLRDIRATIRRVVRETYEKDIFPYRQATGIDPAVTLVIGAQGSDGKDAVFYVADNSVSSVQRSVFAGSGADIAEYFAEKVFDTKRQTTAVTHHIAQQLLREIKGRGIFVGGNSEIYARRSTEHAEPFFQIRALAAEKRPMWGLEDALWSALRVAFNRQWWAFKGSDVSRPLLNQLEAIRKSLAALYADSHVDEKDKLPTKSLELYTFEYPTGIGDPHKDVI